MEFQVFVDFLQTGWNVLISLIFAVFFTISGSGSKFQAADFISGMIMGALWFIFVPVRIVFKVLK